MSNAGMAEHNKYEITVTARTTYIPEQSDEAAGRYVFAYTITIVNSGSVAARLISRHWIITDADEQGAGSARTRRGRAAAAAEAAGESYEYTSGTAIATPVGTMRGSYQMVAEDGVAFDAPIPVFTLSVPRVLH